MRFSFLHHFQNQGSNYNDNQRRLTYNSEENFRDHRANIDVMTCRLFPLARQYKPVELRLMREHWCKAVKFDARVLMQSSEAWSEKSESSSRQHALWHHLTDTAKQHGLHETLRPMTWRHRRRTVNLNWSQIIKQFDLGKINAKNGAALMQIDRHLERCKGSQIPTIALHFVGSSQQKA